MERPELHASDASERASDEPRAAKVTAYVTEATIDLQASDPLTLGI